MRVRVPVATHTRLRQLEGIKKQNLPVGGWPSIIGVDEWEAVASDMQDALVAEANDEQIKPLLHLPSLQLHRKADDLDSNLRPGLVLEQYFSARKKALDASRK